MNGIHLAYNLIKPTDKVLDVGGHYQPFSRANAVIDIMPYRGRHTENAFLKNIPERFKESDWTVQDICDHTKPFPYKDKEFDFVVCGHVIEDIRDPIYAVREMQRVAKRGYIEVPSRFQEQMAGVENKKILGNSHHRWFVEVRQNLHTGKNELIFVFKNHLVHVDHRYEVKRPTRLLGHRPQMNPFYAVLGMVFDDAFEVHEDVQAAVSNSHDFMAETPRIAAELGDKLWDDSEGFPVEMKEIPVVHGIKSLWELQPSIGKRIRMYGDDGSRTREIHQYEKELK